MVQRSALNLLTVINDILDFSKMEVQRLELEALEIDLRDVVEDTVELVARAAHAKGLELVTLIAPGLETRVLGDPGRLRQLLTNLLSNAIKFTERGHVVVSLDADADADADAEAEAEADAGSLDGASPCDAAGGRQRRWRLAVSDSGVGIAPAMMPRLFHAFTQADGSMSRRYGGTGLGLAIAKQLVSLMGGEIAVASAEGQGSTFTVTLPLPPSPAIAAAPGPEAEAEARRELAQLEGARAVIVDASRPVRRALVEQLASYGMVCDAVASPEAAAVCLAAALEAGSRHRLVIAAAPIAWPGAPAQAPAWIALAEGEVPAAPSEAAAPSLAKPIRRGRLLSALRQAFHLAPPPRPRPLPSRHSLAHASRAPGLRVLVAEDNVINQEVTLGMLTDLGCTAVVVADGHGVLEAAAREHFDVVLMDCQMPRLDGFEASRELRRRELAGEPRLPIIALTASTGEEERQACRQAGMDDFLSKPFQRQQLAALLDRVVPPAPPRRP